MCFLGRERDLSKISKKQNQFQKLQKAVFRVLMSSMLSFLTGQWGEMASLSGNTEILSKILTLSKTIHKS